MVFARQPLLPPSIKSFANSAGPTPDLVTDIFYSCASVACGERCWLGAGARVDGVPGLLPLLGCWLYFWAAFRAVL